MSTKQPRSASFKLKVALAALSGKETIVDICQHYKVSESLVGVLGRYRKKACLVTLYREFASIAQLIQPFSALKTGFCGLS